MYAHECTRINSNQFPVVVMMLLFIFTFLCCVFSYALSKTVQKQMDKMCGKNNKLPSAVRECFFVLCAFMWNFCERVCVYASMHDVFSYIFQLLLHEYDTCAVQLLYKWSQVFYSRTSMKQCFYNEHRSTLKSSQTKCRMNTLLENSKLNKALKHTDKHWQMTIRGKKQKSW